MLFYRETLSPVDEILTLVTSPSSVPYVPSSPVKSLATPALTPGEISLECDENILEVNIVVVSTNDEQLHHSNWR